jgi:hypothetical protein
MNETVVQLELMAIDPAIPCLRHGIRSPLLDLGVGRDGKVDGPSFSATAASEGERRQHDDASDGAGGVHGDLDVPASVGISPVVYSSVVRPNSSTAAAGAP